MKGTICDYTNDNKHRLCQLTGSLNMTAGHVETEIDHILATRGIYRKTTDTRTYKGRGYKKERKRKLLVQKICRIKNQWQKIKNVYTRIVRKPGKENDKE